MIIHKEMKKVKTKEEAVQDIINGNLYFKHFEKYVKSSFCEKYKFGHHNIRHKPALSALLFGEYYIKQINIESIY